MHHVGLLTGQAADPLLVHPHAVRQRGARARDPHRIEVGDLVVARLFADHLQLDRRFGGVRVDRGAGPLGEIAHRAQQRPRAAGHEARRVTPAQPAVRRTVPLRAQVRRLLEGPLGWLLQSLGRGGRVHQTFPGGRAQADRLQRLKGSAGVAHRLHIEDRRRAAEQQLGRAKHRGPVHGFLGVRSLERPDALGEPRLEREIVGEPAEQRLAEMDVGLDETRDDHESRTVQSLPRLPPSSPVLHRLDLPVLYDDVPLHHSPLRVHRDHLRAGEAQLHVVTLGLARVVSSGRSKYARSSSMSSSSAYTPVSSRSGLPGSIST